MTDIPSELQDRFEIHESIGEGRAGRAYKANEKSSGRAGVLKLIGPSVVSSVTSRQRLKRELSKQATLNHPHLGLPWLSGEVDKQVWYFRGYAPGQTLRERLDESTRMPASEALICIAQIASGLEELHRAGLLCRDLKPGHIVWDGSSATLIDAGVASDIEHEELFELAGTDLYLSPEQAKGKLVSFRSDLYALGCVMHEIFAGAPPFSGDLDALIDAHANADIPRPPNALPKALHDLHQSLLQKAPRERPVSAHAIRRQLDPHLPAELQSSETALPARGGSTLQGMPTSGPPKPPSMSSPPKPPSMQAPAKKKPKSADVTQQVALEDILEEIEAKPSIPPAPPSVSSAPPPPSASAAKIEVPKTPATPAEIPASNESPLSTSGETTTSGAETLPSGSTETSTESEEIGPEQAGAAMALDYDDDAETVARDVPLDLKGMKPDLPEEPEPPTTKRESVSEALAAQTLAAREVPKTTPAPANAVPATQAYRASNADIAPAAGPQVVYVEKDNDNKNGLYMLLAAALFLLGVALFVGYGIIKDAEEEVATDIQVPAPAIPGAPSTPPANEEAEAPEAPSGPTVTPLAQEPEVEATDEGSEEVAPEGTEEGSEIGEDEGSEEALVAAAPEETEEEPSEPEVAAPASSMNSSMGGSSMGGSSMRSGGAFNEARALAREHFGARRYAQAEQAYLRATSLNPRHAGSWAGLGECRGRLGNYRGAVQAYQRAVRLNPRSAGFFTSLGHAYRLSGNQSAARQAYQRAVTLNPDNASARRYLQ